MSEQQFWTKYFESLHFHRESKKSTISTQPMDEEFNKAAAEEDNNNGYHIFFFTYVNKEPIVIKRKLKTVDPSIDISAEVEDNLCGPVNILTLDLNWSSIMEPK